MRDGPGACRLRPPRSFRVLDDPNFLKYKLIWRYGWGMSNTDSSASDVQPDPDSAFAAPLDKWQRIAAATIGLLLTVGGAVSVFRGKSQAGSVALLLGGLAFLLIAVIGGAPRRAPLRRRYGDFKGPPAVTPVFVRDNKRVAALITVICLALLLFCLIERQVRRALGSEHKMHGPYPDSQKVQPTGRMVLYHQSDLRLRVTSATDPPVIAITRGIQLYLIDLLGLEPARPRRPQS